MERQVIFVDYFVTSVTLCQQYANLNALITHDAPFWRGGLLPAANVLSYK